LEADADEILSEFAQHKKTEDFGGGKRGEDVTAKGKQWTRDDLAGKTPAEINKARSEGLLDTLLQGGAS
jgi:hypothetical protein